MKWHRVEHELMSAHGDLCFSAAVGGRTYVVASIAGHSITASWSDTTREGPRLGSKELPVGQTYPRLSPHVHQLGDTFASIHEAQQACARHHRASMQ